MVTRVLTDANFLYSRTLRDWLFILNLKTANQMFRVTYTVDILAETIRSLRRSTSLDGGQLTKLSDTIVANMDERIDDYPNRNDSPCDDPFDAHVHAAAVAGRVNLLVTHDSHFRHTNLYDPLIAAGCPKFSSHIQTVCRQLALDG